MIYFALPEVLPGVCIFGATSLTKKRRILLGCNTFLYATRISRKNDILLCTFCIILHDCVLYNICGGVMSFQRVVKRSAYILHFIK